MALPINYDTVTVKGRFVYLDGSPARGVIRFTGKVPAISAATQTIIVPATITATLDADGQFSVALPATNDPDIQPNGWTYSVSEELSNGGGRGYEIDVPLSSQSFGIDLSEVAPVAPSAGASSAFVTLTKFNTIQADLAALRKGFSKTVMFTSPVVGSFPVWQAGVDCQIASIRGFRQGGTGASVNARVNATPAAGVDLSLTTADTWLSSTLVDPMSLPQGSTLFMNVISVAGAPSLITVQIDLEVV